MMSTVLISILILSSLNALPKGVTRELNKTGYILVDTARYDTDERKSKPVSSVTSGFDFGRCAFHYVADYQQSRIPPNLNVAVLKNSTHDSECMKLTYEFTVLEQCDDCQDGSFGIIYKLSKQTKVIGFVKRTN